MSGVAFLVDELAAFPQRLRAHYAAVPAAAAQWTPTSWDGIPSERFSPLGQLCHLRDIEIDGYHVRFARARREACPTLDDLDSDALALERDYAACRDAEPVLQAFAAARARTVALLAGLSPAQWARTARFGAFGEVGVRGLAHVLCSHDQQHLAGLQWLLARLDAAASPMHHARGAPA